MKNPSGTVPPTRQLHPEGVSIWGEIARLGGVALNTLNKGVASTCSLRQERPKE